MTPPLQFVPFPVGAIKFIEIQKSVYCTATAGCNSNSDSALCRVDKYVRPTDDDRHGQYDFIYIIHIHFFSGRARQVPTPVRIYFILFLQSYVLLFYPRRQQIAVHSRSVHSKQL